MARTDPKEVIKALDAELARMRQSAARDLARLRELKWMFFLNLIPAGLLIFLKARAFDEDLWSILACYDVTVGLVISGWAVYRSIRGFCTAERRIFFVPYTVIFGFILLFFAQIWIDAYDGSLYWWYHCQIHLRKK